MRPCFHWLILLLLSTTSSLAAQEAADYRVYSTVRADGQVYIRWAPQTALAFRQLLDGGLTVEILSVNDGQTSLVERLTPRPLALANYLAVTNNMYDSISVAHLYYDELSGEDWESLKDDEIPGLPPADRDLELLLNHNYSTVNNWRSSQRSGQGWALALDAMEGGIAVKLYPTTLGDTIYYQANLSDFEPTPTPELTGEFNNRRVKLKWRTFELSDAYWGWHLEQSVDGRPFEQITTAPYMNIVDTAAGVPDEMKYLYRTVPITENNVPITYRLRGQDFLGFRSENYSELTGAGFEDVAFSPSIHRTIQTDSNYAVIQWKFDEAQEDLVDFFRIIVADTAGGDYVTALDEIGAEVREVAVPMKYQSNFYRIQVVTKTGRTISSFESLVMAYDTDPPAVPRNFAGYIDTAGIAHFTWKTSNEPDLAGYYLFKSYYGSGELAMITPDPLPGPEHIDTVNMVTGNEHVYYQLRSVDTRGNGSDFSPKLKLKKPDRYPPVSPQFQQGEASEYGIELSWVSSPSNDVVRYELLREQLGEEGLRTTILAFDTSAYRSAYVDAEVEVDVAYRYFLRVIDDDGLASDDSQPVTVEMSDFGLRAPIEDISVAAQPEEITVTLNWSYAARPAEFYLYRGETGKQVSLLKVLDGTDRGYVDMAVKKGRDYRYLLQAVFEDGGVSPFSREVGVMLE